MIAKLVRLLRSTDALILLSFVGISLVLWWPTRYLPYHWDSAGFVINAAKELVDTNFWPLIAKYSDFSQPPLIIAALALIWATVGNQPLYFHLFMFPFLPILMVATYKMNMLLHQHRPAAILAAVAIASTPVVLAEYGMIYLDLPSASLAAASLWLWVEKKKWPAVIVYTAAVLSKISVLSLLPVFVLLENKHPKRAIKNAAPFLALPLIAITLFLTFHYFVTGWVLVKPDRPTITATSLTDFFDSVQFVITKLVISQNRWIFTVSTIAALVVFFPKKSLKQIVPHRFWVLAGGLATGIAFFAWTGEFAERYGIFLLPLAYTIFVWTWVLLEKHANLPYWWHVPISLSVIGGLVFAWHPAQAESREFNFRPPSDLTYQDAILVHRKAAALLQIRHSDAIIYGSFPETTYLSQPYQHYVTAPLDIRHCHEFSYIPQEDQILYVHPTSPGQIDCRQIFDTVNASFLQRFSHNQAWVELYQIIDPVSTVGESSQR